MRLQELVEVLPDFGDPLDDLLKGRIAGASLDLLVDGATPEEPSEESLDGLHVIGAQHPAEVVMQLEVGAGAGGLVHGANDVRTRLVRHAQQAVEDLAQGAHVVQVVQDDDARQLGRRVLALVSDVGQVLAQLLARLVVHVEGGDGARRGRGPLAGHQVLGQLARQVRLARAAGAAQDDAAMLSQQRDVALDDGAGDEALEGQRVHLLLPPAQHQLDVGLLAHQVAAGQQLGGGGVPRAKLVGHHVALHAVSAQTHAGARVHPQHVFLQRPPRGQPEVEP